MGRNVARGSATTASRAGARRRLSAKDYQALGAFRLALRKFLAFSEVGARALGLSPQQHQALLAIKAHTGAKAMTIGELAQSLLIKSHSAVGLVGRLVERGLLTREPSVEDRRRILLSLTPEAERILEIISRNNLGELRTRAEVIVDLLRTLDSLEQSGSATAPVEPTG